MGESEGESESPKSESEGESERNYVTLEGPFMIGHSYTWPAQNCDPKMRI